MKKEIKIIRLEEKILRLQEELLDLKFDDEQYMEAAQPVLNRGVLLTKEQTEGWNND